MNKPADVLKLSLAAVASTYAVVFFFGAFLIGPWDYDHLSGYWELAWRFWRTSPGLPQFNPYLCGGRTLGGDPQLPVFHPFVALVPILGATVLIKWEMLLQLLFGALGLDGLLQHHGVAPAGRRWGLFLYVAGGAVVARFLVGHVTLGFLFLYPLFLLLSYRGARLPYWGLFLYASYYKPNFLIYAVPALLVEATARAAFSKNPRILVDFVIGVVLGTLGAAVSLLPSWRYFTDFPRLDGSQPILVPIYAFMANVLLPLKAIPSALYGAGFLQRHEFNLFLGPVALYYAARGTRGKTPEWRALVVFTVFSLWIGFGAPTAHFSPAWIYSWFRPFWPGFASIRVPTRFWFGTYLGLVVFSARGFRLPETRGAYAAWLGLGVLPLLAGAIVNLAKPAALAVETQWTVPRLYPASLVQVANNLDFHYRHLRAGTGVIGCVDNIQIHQARIQAGPALPGDGEWRDWSHIHLAGAGAGLRTLNVNHHPYWHATGGTIVSRLGQRLTVKADGPVDLEFTQPYVAHAALLTASTWLLFVLMCAHENFRPHRRNRRR